jgi:hypothetical protein
MISKLSRKTQDRRLHSLTNFITRDVMRLIRGIAPYLPSSKVSKDDFITDLETESNELFEILPGQFPLRVDKSTLQEDYIENIDTELSITIEIDRASDRFNVSASDKPLLGEFDVGMHLLVEIPENLPNEDKKMLRDEVSNSIRHELEHISQGQKSDNPFSVHGRGLEYYSFINSPDDVKSPMAKYLLEPTEIPAFVRGHSQNAKSSNSLVLKIKRFLTGYSEKGFIDDEEKDIIFNTWIEWSQRFLNQKRFLN